MSAPYVAHGPTSASAAAGAAQNATQARQRVYEVIARTLLDHTEAPMLTEAPSKADPSYRGSNVAPHPALRSATNPDSENETP